MSVAASDVLVDSYLASFSNDALAPPVDGPAASIPADLASQVTARSLSLLALVKLLHKPLTSTDPAERAKGAQRSLRDPLHVDAD